MKTQGEHIRTLRRRVDFLKTRDYRNSYDQAELGALEWALVNLPPAQRQWVDLTGDEIVNMLPDDDTPMSLGEAFFKFAELVEAKLKEKNT
jgi:hypothetical protein